MVDLTRTDKCCKTVYAGSFRGRKCDRKVWKDGFCKQHHPDSVKARQKASEARWKEKQSKDPLRIAMVEIQKLKQKNEKLRAALIAYVKAGIGNSTDFALQAEAYNLALEATDHDSATISQDA